MTDTPKQLTVFISYAHTDNENADRSQRWLDRVLEHLQSVQLNSTLSVWSDTDLRSGDDWHDKIQQSLADTKVALLLVSAAFLKSEYIRDHEMPLLLQRHRRDELVIISLVIRPCAFDQAVFRFPSPEEGPHETDLSRLQSPAPPAKPLSSLPSHQQDEVLATVARDIKKILAGDRSVSAQPPNQPGNAASRRPRLTNGHRYTLAVALLLALLLLCLPLLFPRTKETGEPNGPDTPSVLFFSFSASDIQRLQGASENDVVRLAAECESEKLRQFAEHFSERPALLFSIVRIIIGASSPSDTTIDFSDSDRRRLLGASETDVVRLARECDGRWIRDLAESFENQPAVLLEIVGVLTK